MQILYSFAHIGHLVDNTPDVVGPIGELSSYSMTFARDKLIYTSAEYPGLNLINFQYRNGDGVDTTLPNGDKNLILEATDWIIKQARFGNFTESIVDFQTKFLTEFTGKIDLLSSGMMVNFGNNLNCPEYVTITSNGNSETKQWMVWLSDNAFRTQCPISHISVVTPIPNLDEFFGDYVSVNDKVTPVDIQGLNDTARLLQGNYPYTDLRTWKFDWVDPNNEANKIPTYWLTIHWGDAGNNLDQAKEAIRDHILENSNRDREEWATIFPDIFTSTEFIIIPHYDLVAVPSKTRQSAIYSPTSNNAKVLYDAYRLVKGVGYNEDHIDSVIETTSSLYRSLSISIVGGSENREDINKFSIRYPDYINVATTHVDFGYMKEETREFVLILSELLSIAESITPSSSIPRKFNRIIRDNQTFIGVNFKDFLWLVVPKYVYDNH